MAKRLAAKQTATLDRVVATNRRARHDYDLIDLFECGIVLQGSEVKSLRTGRAQLNDTAFSWTTLTRPRLDALAEDAVANQVPVALKVELGRAAPGLLP